MSAHGITETLDKISRNFVDVLKLYAQHRILTQDTLQDYYKMSPTLHGILVSALAEAGYRAELLPVIEPRVPYSEPLVPSRYNLRLSTKPYRKREYLRLDLGFYREALRDMDIFAECNTIDSALGYQPSEGKNYLTKRDLYLHFAHHAYPKASGLIVCITLPRNVTHKPSFPDFKQYGGDYFGTFKTQWEELAKILQQHIQTLSYRHRRKRGIHQRFVSSYFNSINSDNIKRGFSWDAATLLWISIHKPPFSLFWAPFPFQF